MTYSEQGPKETEVEHLLRNSGALGLDARAKARLREAYRLERGSRAEQRRAGEIAAEVKRALLSGQHETLLAEARHDAALGPMLLGNPRALEGEADAGSPVAEFNDAGALALGSRDGFAHLRELAKISQAEFEAGLIYRYAYELEACDLRSQLDDSGGGGGIDHARYVIARLHRAQRAQLRIDVEVAVIQACRGARSHRGRRELKVLRAVAGEGLSLRSLSSGGAMQAINLAALIRALAAARTVIRVFGLA